MSNKQGQEFETTKDPLLTASSPLPGERIRIEEYHFAADNFVAAAYFPENQLRKIRLVSLLAVDVATDYVVGFRLTTKPTELDALELVAMIMRDKTSLARQFGFCDWKGWCRPKVIEAEGVFDTMGVRERLAETGIEVQPKDSNRDPAETTMRLAQFVCVSPALVSELRAQQKHPATHSGPNPVDRSTYLRSVVEREFLRAIAMGFQDDDD